MVAAASALFRKFRLVYPAGSGFEGGMSMPGSVNNNNPTNFIQTASFQTTERLRRAIQQPESATRSGGLTLESLRELSAQVAKAVDTAQTAQVAISKAQAAGETLRGVERQLLDLRNLASGATDPDLSAGERSTLAERFATVQDEINAKTEAVTFQGQTLNERLEVASQEAVEVATESLALDIGSADGAAAALTGIDATLSGLSRLQAEIRKAQTATRQTVTDAFTEIAANGGSGIGMDTHLAAGLEQNLRALLLEGATSPLQVQGGLNRETLIDLLGDF